MRTPRSLTRRELFLASAGGAAMAAVATASPAAARWPAIRVPDAAEATDLQQAARDAYIFGYPLVLMDVTRQQMTAVPAAAPALMKAPVNQFTHVPGFPDATFHSVVSPNVDTLYSVAWLDLQKEPMVLSLPDTRGRYYLMPMYDAWTNVFASPGARTTGTGAGNYAVVGPHWTGSLPPDLHAFHAPTDMAWIIGRTQANGPADYAFVHSLQAQYRLTPLSAWGKSYTPPTNVPVDPAADTVTAPVDQVAHMTTQTFWSRFAALMTTNPPAVADAPVVARLAPLGIVPGQALDWARLSPAQTEALDTGRAQGLAAVEAAGKKPPVAIVNTWSISTHIGTYGTNYLLRAGVAWVGLGANLPEDAIFPRTAVDRTGQALDGAHRYVLHFAKADLPPVNAFWSLTMYNDRQFLVDNPLNRYAIRDRDAQLVYGPDGALDIVIQHASPGTAQEGNWLPAPAGAFNLVLRLYWPKPPALDGSWAPPAVTKVS